MQGWGVGRAQEACHALCCCCRCHHCWRSCTAAKPFLRTHRTHSIQPTGPPPPALSPRSAQGAQGAGRGAVHEARGHVRRRVRGGRVGLQLGLHRRLSFPHLPHCIGDRPAGRAPRLLTDHVLPCHAPPTRRAPPTCTPPMMASASASRTTTARCGERWGRAIGGRELGPVTLLVCWLAPLRPRQLAPRLPSCPTLSTPPHPHLPLAPSTPLAGADPGRRPQPHRPGH